MLRTLMILSALTLAACHGKPERRQAPGTRVGLTKPTPGNVHDRAACPPLVKGTWQTDEGQKIAVDDDGNQMTITTSDDNQVHPVDGLVYVANGVTTVASCSNGALNYAYLNGERKVHMQITTEGVMRGKLQTKTENLDTKTAAAAPLEREYVLTRPSDSN